MDYKVLFKSIFLHNLERKLDNKLERSNSSLVFLYPAFSYSCPSAHSSHS